MKITIDRLTSGKPTTLKERWYCFHRLYRLARKADETAFHQSNYDSPAGGYAVDTLRMLGYDRWINLLQCSGDWLEYKSAASSQVRRDQLAMDRRLRLYGSRYTTYGDNPRRDELLCQDRRLVRRAADKYGKELTLDEAAEERARLCRAIRAEAAKRGAYFPEGPGRDIYVLRWLQKR